jgi:hypothetical protein
MCYVYAPPYSFMNCGKRMTVVMPHCYNYHKNSSSDSLKSLSLSSVLYFLKCCNLRSQLESAGSPESSHEEELLGVGAPPGATILHPAASILQLQYISLLTRAAHHHHGDARGDRLAIDGRSS